SGVLPDQGSSGSGRNAPGRLWPHADRASAVRARDSQLSMEGSLRTWHRRAGGLLRSAAPGPGVAPARSDRAADASRAAHATRERVRDESLRSSRDAQVDGELECLSAFVALHRRNVERIMGSLFRTAL